MTEDEEVMANTAVSIFEEKSNFEEHLSEMCDYNIELETKVLKLFSKELEVLKKFKKYPMTSDLKSILNQILKHRTHPKIFAEVLETRQEIHKFYEKYKEWNNNKKIEQSH